MQLEIISWTDYNPRKDLKSTAWFRLENTFWLNQDFFEFDCQMRMVWIALLSTASQNMNGNIRISPQMIAANLRISQNKVLETIKILEQKQYVHVHVTSTSRSRTTTNEQANERTNDICSFDFDKLYKLYPRKKGKSRAFQIMKRDITSEVKYELLNRAIKNYADHCKGSEIQYVKYFSSFMSEWKDWIEVDSEGKPQQGIQEILGVK